MIDKIESLDRLKKYEHYRDEIDTIVHRIISIPFSCEIRALTVHKFNVTDTIIAVSDY